MGYVTKASCFIVCVGKFLNHILKCKQMDTHKFFYGEVVNHVDRAYIESLFMDKLVMLKMVMLKLVWRN